ncbi:MAG: NAD(P)-dependent oxidoreductase [Alphaproteobacteria bacterium]
MSTRILNLEPDHYSAAARAILGEIARIDDGPLSRAQLLQRIGNYDAVIVRFGHRIDREVLTSGRQLRAVACAATGTDHIDAAYAAKSGVAIISLFGESEFLRSVPASAEHSWALLLALTRRIPAAAASVRKGAWTRDAFRGRDLAGRTLGIVGCGRIGEKIAAYGSAFGMNVLAFDPLRATLPAGVERTADLDAVLRAADIVTVHVPLNETTRNMFGAAQFAAMRNGAVLVNTARGAIVDEAALLAALESGKLAGAALDVLADEQPSAVAANKLVAYAAAHENLIITPHIAGATADSMAATEIFVARKLVEFLKTAQVRSA